MSKPVSRSKCRYLATLTSFESLGGNPPPISKYKYLAGSLSLQSTRVLDDVKVWATAYAEAFTLQISFYAPRAVAFPSTGFDRNLTATGCLYLSLCVPLRELKPVKSAVLSLPVPPCPPVSCKENDYESEGRRFESCRARYKSPANAQKQMVLVELPGAIGSSRYKNSFLSTV